MSVFLSITYWIILIYIALSLLVLFFVLTYKEFMLRRLKNEEKHLEKWRSFFLESVPILSDEDIQHLKNPDELMHFTKILQAYNQEPDKEARMQEFLYTHVHAWVELGDYYADKSLILRAYFAWCGKEANIRQPIDDSELIQLMQRYALFPSIHSRNNALGALYSFGNIKGVVDAFRLLSEQKATFNARLLADGLSSFTGDKQALADALYENFEDFGQDFQVGIMDFFQRESAHLKHRLIDFLKKPSLNLELVCALMRYYEKHPVQEYKSILLSWMSGKYRYKWEILAVTASTLASYPGEDTVHILKKCLEADNWFIRKNAALSLVELNIKEPRIDAVLSGENPHTIDQVTYDLASKEPV